MTYEYDADLNQVAKVQDGQHAAYLYNVRDYMVAADVDGALTRFDYDAGGIRVKKISAGAETRYVYDDNAVLVETDGGGQTIQKYDYGYELLALTTVSGAGRASEFYLTDALMSTANLADEPGDLVQSYRYDAWGRTLDEVGSSSNPRQYTGHYHDDETGLDYFGARYYDSEIGRFLSQDTYLGEADPPPSLHRYLYAYANPLRYVDLTGYSAETVTPEEYNSSALESEGTFSGEMTTGPTAAGISPRRGTATRPQGWSSGSMGSIQARLERPGTNGRGVGGRYVSSCPALCQGSEEEV